MKRNIEMLKRYLDTLTKDTDWQIIIEDFYGVLRPFGDIREYLSDKNWHNNPYCLAVKKNGRLWRRCVALKRATRRSIRRRGKAGWSVCYCGVAEYTIPVFVNGVHIATVSAAGFIAPLKDKMTEILSKRTGYDKNQFRNLREASLRQVTAETEERLFSYLSVVADTIENVALQSPLIKSEGEAGRPDEKQRYVLKAIDHIEKHFSEDISPESVAKRCHLSLSYMQHLFLKYAGEGIASIIRRKRLEEACRLLTETNRSVRDISLSCGFYDTDYFSVTFKRSYGMTPLNFRKQRRIDI